MANLELISKHENNDPTSLSSQPSFLKLISSYNIYTICIKYPIYCLLQEQYIDSWQACNIQEYSGLLSLMNNVSKQISASLYPKDVFA